MITSNSASVNTTDSTDTANGSNSPLGQNLNPFGNSSFDYQNLKVQNLNFLTWEIFTERENTDIQLEEQYVRSYIAYRAGNGRDGGECFAGVDTIARDLGISKNTARKHIRILVHFGHIIHENSRSQYGTNVYRINPNADEWKPITKQSRTAYNNLVELKKRKRALKAVPTAPAVSEPFTDARDDIEGVQNLNYDETQNLNPNYPKDNYLILESETSNFDYPEIKPGEIEHGDFGDEMIFGKLDGDFLLKFPGERFSNMYRIILGMNMGLRDFFTEIAKFYFKWKDRINDLIALDEEKERKEKLKAEKAKKQPNESIERKRRFLTRYWEIKKTKAKSGFEIGLCQEEINLLMDANEDELNSAPDPFDLIRQLLAGEGNAEERIAALIKLDEILIAQRQEPQEPYTLGSLNKGQNLTPNYLNKDNELNNHLNNQNLGFLTDDQKEALRQQKLMEELDAQAKAQEPVSETAYDVNADYDFPGGIEQYLDADRARLEMGNEFPVDDDNAGW